MEWDTITMLVGLGVTLLSGAGAFFRVKSIAEAAIRQSNDAKHTLFGQDGMGGMVSKISHLENQVGAMQDMKKELDSMKQKQDTMYNLLVQIASKLDIKIPY